MTFVSHISLLLALFHILYVFKTLGMVILQPEVVTAYLCFYFVFFFLAIL